MSIRHRLASVLVASTLTMCCVPLSLFADGVTLVSSGSVNVFAGDTFNVPVNVTDVSDLFAFQFDLSFDPTVLELLNITEGSFLQGAGTTFFVPGTIDNTAGTATATADSLVGAIPGASGSGPLAIFSFEALAPGTSALTLSNVVLEDSLLNEIAFTTTDGQVNSAAPEPRLLPLLAVMLPSTFLVARRFRKRAS